MNIIDLIGRKKELLKYDISYSEPVLKKHVSESSFLVIGRAGSIGREVPMKFLNVIQKKSMLLI